MKVPQGNYAMGNSHFNKLDSHILLIMVNLIIPFKPCLHTHTKKILSFYSYMFFLFLYPSLQTKTTLYVILNFLEKKYSRLFLPHNYKLKIREHTINLTQNIFK